MITLNQDILKIRSSADQIWEGIPAVNGESAFEIAKRVKKLPPEVTEEQWLDSLKVVALKEEEVIDSTTVADYLTGAIRLNGQPTELSNGENPCIINFQTNNEEDNPKDLFLLDSYDLAKINDHIAGLEHRVETVEELLKLSDCGILDVDKALKQAY